MYRYTHVLHNIPQTSRTPLSRKAFNNDSRPGQPWYLGDIIILIVRVALREKMIESNSLSVLHMRVEFKLNRPA